MFLSVDSKSLNVPRSEDLKVLTQPPSRLLFLYKYVSGLTPYSARLHGFSLCEQLTSKIKERANR